MSVVVATLIVVVPGQIQVLTAMTLEMMNGIVALTMELIVRFQAHPAQAQRNACAMVVAIVRKMSLPPQVAQ